MVALPTRMVRCWAKERRLLALPGFWLGLVGRLGLLACPTSRISRELFEPFLQAGVTGWPRNPWAAMPTAHFPYGTVLYALLAAPRHAVAALLGPAALADPVLSQALVKAPLLACDVVLLTMLCWLSPKREPSMVRAYWLNPVLIYITYVHGQLDVATTMFATASLLALMKGKPARAGVAWAAAALCKAHVLVGLPFVLAYLHKRHFGREASRQMAAFGLCFAASFGVGMLPLWWAGVAGYATAASPQAMRLLAAPLQMGGDNVLHLGLASSALLLGRLCVAGTISETGLLMGTGVLFGALSLACGAMPGWYFWSLPTVCLLYVHYLVAPRLCAYAFTALYVSYFAWLDYGPWPMPQAVREGTFTLVQAAYAALLIAVWCLSCRRELPLERQGRPLLLGVAGDSGTGKNLLSEIILQAFGREQAALLEGDDYHRWERTSAKWADYTHLHPKANALDALALHTSELVGGRHVWQPHYDHQTGTFTEPRQIGAARVVVVQGLHTLYLRDMRAQFDLKIFLAPHELVRLAWKVHRDCTERGHDRKKVLESIARRRADADMHISPQRAVADWILEASPMGPLTREEVLAGASPALCMHHILWNDAPVTELVAALLEAGIDASLNVEKSDIDRIRLSVYDEPTAQQVAAIARLVLPRLRTVTRARREPTWCPGHHGVNQLILFALLGKRGVRDTLYAAASERMVA